MIEQPEAVALSRQMNDVLKGKTIAKVVAGHSPHRFAFFEGDPARYPGLLVGQTLQNVQGLGAYVKMQFDDVFLLLRDGVNPRYYRADAPKPNKHQLYLAFKDGDALVFAVQMYGVMQAFANSEEDKAKENFYYQVVFHRPAALDDAFDEDYFMAMFDAEKPTLSAKAFLATEQRIPGIGNGVLQDILLNARVHPKSKIGNLPPKTRQGLYHAVKSTMGEMTRLGGRNTEKDLFGNPGGYHVLLGSKTLAQPCPVCGGAVQRLSYLGGNVYVCPVCQPIL